jgi:ribosomal protein L24
MALERGDVVTIIAGNYKGKQGEYRRPAGRLSAAIAIEGDSVQERTLRLTSLKLKTPNKKDSNTNTKKKEAIIEEITKLQLRLEELRLQVKDLD